MWSDPVAMTSLPDNNNGGDMRPAPSTVEELLQELSLTDFVDAFKDNWSHTHASVRNYLRSQHTQHTPLQA